MIPPQMQSFLMKSSLSTFRQIQAEIRYPMISRAPAKARLKLIPLRELMRLLALQKQLRLMTLQIQAMMSTLILTELNLNRERQEQCFVLEMIYPWTMFQYLLMFSASLLSSSSQQGFRGLQLISDIYYTIFFASWNCLLTTRDLGDSFTILIPQTNSTAMGIAVMINITLQLVMPKPSNAIIICPRAHPRCRKIGNVILEVSLETSVSVSTAALQNPLNPKLTRNTPMENRVMFPLTKLTTNPINISSIDS